MSTPETLAAWTLAAMVEAELMAVEVATGHSFAGARRPLNAAERASKVRFADIDAYVTAATEAARPWVRRLLSTGAEVILNHVFPYGADALAATAAAELTALGSSLVDRAAPVLAEVAPLISEALDGSWRTGAQMVTRELGEQGAPVAGWTVPVAPSTVEALAESIATHPLLRQLERASRYVNDPARTLAGRVERAALEALLGDTAEGASVDVMHQGVQSVLAMGRWATVAANGGDFAVAYASAVLDTNACPPCRATDGKRYDSLEDAVADFPLGGNLDCHGGARCRCLLVWVYTAPNVTPTVTSQ